MDQGQRHLVAGLVVLVGGVLVTMAAIERLSSPAVRALGQRELLIMAGLFILGMVLVILGAFEAAGSALLPDIFPSVVACLGGMFAGIDVVRIYVDTMRMLGDSPGPLAAVPSSSNRELFLGAVLSGGGGILLAQWGVGATKTTQNPDPSKTRTDDPAKTYHANRWWMRDGSGSVLVWDDQAQTWSPWVNGTDPALPPGWSAG